MTAARAGMPVAKSLSGSDSARVETATQLARLERQRTMLQKQLQVWRKQKQKTEERLAAVEAQIEAVCKSLTRAHAPSSGSPALPGTSVQSSHRIAFNYRD